jgi:hypothetical protein
MDKKWETKNIQNNESGGWLVRTPFREWDPHPRLYRGNLNPGLDWLWTKRKKRTKINLLELCHRWVPKFANLLQCTTFAGFTVCYRELSMVQTRWIVNFFGEEIRRTTIRSWSFSTVPLGEHRPSPCVLFDARYRRLKDIEHTTATGPGCVSSSPCTHTGAGPWERLF